MPSIIEADSRYLVATLYSAVPLAGDQRLLRVVLDVGRGAVRGQENALKASIASGLGASIHFSGSATSGPPSGAGITGSLVAASLSLGVLSARTGGRVRWSGRYRTGSEGESVSSA